MDYNTLFFAYKDLIVQLSKDTAFSKDTLTCVTIPQRIIIRRTQEKKVLNHEPEANELQAFQAFS